MALWNKLRTELDRAGRVANDALVEGKLRLEVFRARHLVDRAAQSLGYAVYRARTGKETPDDHAMVRLVDAVRTREEELAVLEDRMRTLTGRNVPADGAPRADAPPPPASSASPSPGPASDGPAATLEGEQVGRARSSERNRTHDEGRTGWCAPRALGAGRERRAGVAARTSAGAISGLGAIVRRQRLVAAHQFVLA